MSDFFSLGVQAIIANLVFTFFGLLDQAKLLHKTKDATSMSIPKWVLLVYSLVVNIAYIRDDGGNIVFLLPCSVQLVVALFLTGMVLYYKKFPGGYQAARPRLA